MITLGLISVQLVLIAVMSLVSGAEAEEYYIAEREELQLECHIDGLCFLLNLSYVMILMFLCTAYALKTRDFPRNYNESKFIGITMYSTCAVWTVFFPLYYNEDHGVQHAYLISGAYVFVGLITLVGLFGQKVFIVLCAKDTSEENVSMSRRTRCSIVPQHNTS
jgi:hypothetical protein